MRSVGLVRILSLQRPGALPRSAPRGQQARDLRTDAYIDHPGYGITPQKMLQIFRIAEMGDPSQQFDLFDDLEELDAHARALFEKRDQAVAGKPWVIQATDQGAEAELAAHVLRVAHSSLPMVEVFEHLLRFNRGGYSLCEIDWAVRRIDGRDWIVPVWYAPVPSRRFRINVGSTVTPTTSGLDELRLFTDSQRPGGDSLVPGKWITVRRSGARIARSGLMRTAAPLIMAKRFGFRDWLIFSERFGLPLPLVKYKTQGEHADDTAKDVGQEVLENFGTDGGALIPDTLEVDIKQIDADNSNVHDGLIQFCNRELSKLVNGSTLANDSTDSGGASYALGEVHDAVRWEAVQYDAEKLQTAFHQHVFAPFCVYNGLPVAPPALKIQVARDVAPGVRIELAAKLKNELGVEVSISQLRSDSGFREPTDDADKAPGMPQPKPGTPPEKKAEA